MNSVQNVSTSFNGFMNANIIQNENRISISINSPYHPFMSSFEFYIDQNNKLNLKLYLKPYQFQAFEDACISASVDRYDFEYSGNFTFYITRDLSRVMGFWGAMKSSPAFNLNLSKQDIQRVDALIERSQNTPPMIQPPKQSTSNLSASNFKLATPSPNLVDSHSQLTIAASSSTTASNASIPDLLAKDLNISVRRGLSAPELEELQRKIDSVDEEIGSHIHGEILCDRFTIQLRSFEQMSKEKSDAFYRSATTSLKKESNLLRDLIHFSKLSTKVKAQLKVLRQKRLEAKTILIDNIVICDKAFKDQMDQATKAMRAAKAEERLRKMGRIK